MVQCRVKTRPMKTTVEHPYYGTITYDTGTDKVTAQKGNLAEQLTWLMHHQEELGGEDYYPHTFFRACEFLGICGGELDVSIKTEGKFTPPPDAELKMIVEHPLYGTLTYDTGTDKVTVQKGNLAERLTYLIHHQDQLGHGYYPSAFYRACEVLGICGGELEVSVKIEGEHDLPPGAVY
jgi:hypothetical protein